MAVLISNGGLVRNGAVLEASDGTKIAVFYRGIYIEVWKDIDGTPSLVGGDTDFTAQGGCC